MIITSQLKFVRMNHLANNQFELHHRLIGWNCKFFFYRKQALQAKLEAEKEGIVVPLTLEEYCLKPKPNPNNQEPQVIIMTIVYSQSR